VLPLAASQIIIPLASLLNPAASSPGTVLAALRTLNTIADSAALEQRPGNEKADWILKSLYADQHLGYLSDIISQDSPALITQQQISLAAALVSKTCHEESSRKQLAYSGVLEALALRVASFVILLAEQKHQEQRRSSNLPKFAIQSAPTRARLAPILQAIAIIITNSSNRVTQFLRAPAFASVFQYSELEGWKISPAKNQSMNNGSFVDVGSLPPLHRSSPSSSTSFPPLGEMARWGKPKPAKDEGSPRAMAGTPEDEETPIAGWLVHVIQAEQGVTRVMAAWLLAILFREGHAGKSRERLLSMQLVPLLVRMLEADNTFSNEVSPSYDDSVIQPPRWLIKRLAPQVLGLLVSENELLQRAASEAGAIKKLSQMLKQTFDPLPQNESLALWNPDPSAETPMPDASSTFSKLGPAGLTPSGYQVLQTRAAVIGAIAAMSTRSDDYRKAIINSGVVAHLISSLKPVPSAPAAAASPDKPKVDPTGNPTLVLMQACAAATALSRSVSTLRTSLIEAGLAKPIFDLLEHPDMQVQIAATGAVCNIVLEFSPMRQVGYVRKKILASMSNFT
jgi:armadillo repeat-containing protein 8